jgi:hypothetical protein
MTTHSAWYYNDMQQIGTDFEDVAQVKPMIAIKPHPVLRKAKS